MSVQTKAQAVLQAKAHNVLFVMQGLIFAVEAIHNDLPSIMTSVQNWIPMIVGIIHLIYHERQVVKDAYNSGESSTIFDAGTKLSAVLASPSADINAVKAVATELLTAINTP